jgi:ribonuclease HII
MIKQPELLEFDEKLLEDNGVIHLIGVDEVGKGSLAGPVMAGACLFSKTLYRDEFAKLNDSKKVGRHDRDRMAVALDAYCPEEIQVRIGKASVEEIAEMGIHEANLLAMRRAIAPLITSLQKSVLIVIDGEDPIHFWSLGNWDWSKYIQSAAIVKGDSKSACIAAASVYAKVIRDDYMTRLGLIEAKYGWAKNKGYGTKDHCEAIREFGLSKWHRASFCKRILGETNE